MSCVSPVWIQDKSTGGTMYVPCGRCMGCRIKRAHMWSLRIMHEVKEWPCSSFVTLTYDDDHLPKNRSLVKEDCQKFLKRLRKNLDREIKYYLSGEYGTLGLRPHYHCILFGVAVSETKILNRSWGLGFVHVGDVTPDSACYVASYTLKKLSGDAKIDYKNRGVIPEFSLMSRAPGIGARYVEKNERFLKQNAFCISKGIKVALPRYYSDKIFSGDEKSLIHTLRQEFYDEEFKKIKAQSGSEHGFQVLDYKRTMRDQAAADLKAREGLKRRKL